MKIQHFSSELTHSKLVSLELKIAHLPRTGLQHLASTSYRACPVAVTFSVDATWNQVRPILLQEKKMNNVNAYSGMYRLLE